MSNEDRTKDIDVMNNLLSLCLDSAKGYREAADTCKTPSLAQIFHTRATERDQVASELTAEITSLNGTPHEHGTIAGSAHRLVMDVRAMVSDDAKATINEVERGEDVIKGAFEKAMANPELSPETQATIERCYSPIRAGHDQMSALKRAAA